MNVPPYNFFHLWASCRIGWLAIWFRVSILTGLFHSLTLPCQANLKAELDAARSALAEAASEYAEFQAEQREKLAAAEALAAAVEVSCWNRRGR